MCKCSLFFAFSIDQLYAQLRIRCDRLGCGVGNRSTEENNDDRCAFKALNLSIPIISFEILGCNEDKVLYFQNSCFVICQNLSFSYVFRSTTELITRYLLPRDI